MKLDKLLYSKQEAAEIIGLSKHTITRDVSSVESRRATMGGECSSLAKKF